MTDKELLLDLFIQEINSVSEIELMETLLKENLKIIRTIKNKQFTKFSQPVPPHCQGVDKSISDKEEYLLLDPEAPADLTSTKIIRYVIGSNEIYERDWIKIIHKLHILAHKEGLSSEDLIKLSLPKANFLQGDLQGEKGYRHLPEIDISIQRENTNTSWSIILNLVKYLKIPIEVYFKWSMKKGSAYPGQKGKLVWIPR